MIMKYIRKDFDWSYTTTITSGAQGVFPVCACGVSTWQSTGVINFAEVLCLNKHKLGRYRITASQAQCTNLAAQCNPLGICISSKGSRPLHFTCKCASNSACAFQTCTNSPFRQHHIKVYIGGGFPVYLLYLKYIFHID